MFAVAVLGYFAFHAFHGSYGLLATEGYERELADAQAVAASLQAQVDWLERRTMLLRDGSLEHDILDEQARRTLGLTRANEIVLLHSNN
ncbi:MAG: septum formation initiator family protein [Ahrensia sp.]